MTTTEAPLPKPLEEIIEFFEMLPEAEKRMNLIAYADHLKKHAPPEGEEMDLADVRKDQECQDTVGIFLKFSEEGGESEGAGGGDPVVSVYVEVGEKAQTLTRALATILCQGLSGSPKSQILALPPTFVPRIVGTQLFRQRSQTVYYVFTRIKNAIKAWEKRKTREAIADADRQAAASN